MEQKRLNLYRIDMKYIRNLAKVDEHVMSVSPQLGKETRPFVGIVIVCDTQKYCIPLSSPKAKHNSMKNDVDFIKIMDGEKLIGVLNLNNMVPVEDPFLFDWKNVFCDIGKNKKSILNPLLHGFKQPCRNRGKYLIFFPNHVHFRFQRRRERAEAQLAVAARIA